MNINPKINNPVQGLQLHSEPTSPLPHPVDEYRRIKKNIAAILLEIEGELWLHGRNIEKYGCSYAMAEELALIEHELMMVLREIPGCAFAHIESANTKERKRHE